MTTRGEWATEVLAALGNRNPDAATVNFLASWSVCEFGQDVKKAARFNPLATKHELPGATNYNSVGVKDYPDPATGIQATIRTIKNGHYPHIVEGLTTNKPEVALNHTELGIWGTGGGCVERIYKNNDSRMLTLPSYDPAIPGGSEAVSTPITIDADTGKPRDASADASSLNPAITSAVDAIETAVDPSVLLARVLMGGIGAIMIGVAGILIIRTYVPTKQIVKTIAAVA
jgi:hypothetical protein